MKIWHESCPSQVNRILAHSSAHEMNSVSEANKWHRLTLDQQCPHHNQLICSTGLPASMVKSITCWFMIPSDSNVHQHSVKTAP